MPELRVPEPEETPEGPPNVPIQHIADYIAEEQLSETKTRDESGYVGFCVECKNVMPDQYMERNIFYLEGSPVPCKFCGGVTAIIPEVLVTQDSFKQRLDRMRGIGSTRDIPTS